MFLVSDREL